ncbi:hypothetical protein LKO27_01375 [Tessaracoccus sp. OS52]|uniref:hypothetical protein n=1 Tax=Tessaracoccus sp. OS52 TaxID=2886691 RepID=UPI001D12F49C|nr:hypothetical protein [Tessaracoccus sp. OS52]MCC2592080.1 hypothetical protein [Tessaracoccus sp. OS52]
MSTLGTYSFLPWLRQGLANQISAPDHSAGVKVRAAIDVQLTAKGKKADGGELAAPPFNHQVPLVGPGDIVGIDRAAVVRSEPLDWITNFEPNYLPFLEFYDEDFPWRYTPAAPDVAKGRLRPWIALVVLAEDEFVPGQNMTDKPLPYIDVADLSVFPKADELWAWAHVHVNRSLAASDDEFTSTDMGAVIGKFSATLAENPDLAYSRLLCPRKLKENTAYHAFLIPTFETGRRAGLGLELGDVVATMSAWDPATRPQGQSFPYYHRWFFRTATSGDFETLVRLLVPRVVDPRVGSREMDVQVPGSGVRGVDNPDLGGILKLGGALKPPSTVPPTPPDVFERWDEPFPRPLQTDLAHLLNLPDDYQREGEPDPIITPPLYGTWHAMARRVLTEHDGSPIAPDDNWIHRLNLDPRYRAAAGIGTGVIQDQQEKLMDAAWEQIGDVLEASRRIRFGQFGLLTTEVWYDASLRPTVGLSRQRGLLLLAPLNKRILTDGVTLHHRLAGSLVQPTLTSAALRRVIRPRGRLMTSLPFDALHRPDDLLDRVNDGDVSAAPPKTAPPGVFTAEEAAELAEPSGAPDWVLDLLRRFPQLAWVILLIALMLALVAFILLPRILGLLVAAALVVAGIVVFRLLSGWGLDTRGADLMDLTGISADDVEDLPPVPNFEVKDVGEPFRPVRGSTDSLEAARFKEALSETLGGIRDSRTVGRPPARGRVDLGRIATTAIEAVRPTTTIPRRVLAGIVLPQRIKDDLVAPPRETFVEPMAYPVIDTPMYEPLKDRSSELFLPNINLIQPNTITLLETNQPFIEAYMVGLNHEFARELLWREYPTDQRGSTFRQFWDVRSFFNTENLDDEALKEKLRDIPPLHEWPKASKLGEHDHREPPGGPDENELVLVIRGELLKRYPNAVVYAHRARWQLTDGGAIDNTVERRLVELTAAEEEKPPTSKLLTPLYEAKVDPDIYFFGFDLTAAEAKGQSGENPGDDPGWFFVIKERPGEPSFGLDTDEAATLNVWNDLSWPLVQPAPAGAHIDLAAAPAQLTVASPGSSDEKYPQYLDDRHIEWRRDSLNSALLAYVTFQSPVLVAVHAHEILPE